MRHPFPKSLRLLKRRQFLSVANRGRRLVGSCLIIDLRRSGHPNARLGITVTKRYGKAYRRNRFKRMVREAFRLHHHQLPGSMDILVRPRNNRQSLEFKNIVQELLEFQFQTS